jgi:hypothetical protein
MPRKPPKNGGNAAPDPACSDCRHWQEQTESQDEVRWGFCQAHPPVPMYTGEPDMPISCVVVWTELPYVCGELQRVLQ